MKELYRSKELDRDRPESIEADFEEVAASCGHFSFSLQAFANEMQTFLSILEELKAATRNEHQRSWAWMKFWRNFRSKRTQSGRLSPEEQPLIDQSRETDLPKDLPDLVLERHKTGQWQGSWSERNKTQGLYRRVLRVIMVLEMDDGVL